MFGNEPCGFGPCGSQDWAHRMFWGYVPEAHRVLDGEIADDFLYKLLSIFEAEYNDAKSLARDLPLQRDALHVRDRNDAFTVEVVSFERTSDDEGDLTILTVVDIGEVRARWLLRIDNTVLRVVSVSADERKIVLRGLYDVEIGEIDFTKPGLLEYLASDYLIAPNYGIAESARRNEIKYLQKFIGWKGAAKAYKTYGLVYGFAVEPKSLYAITDVYESFLPSSHLWVLENVLYTDVEPKFARFDDFAADEIAVDNYVFYEGSEISLWAENVVGFEITGVEALGALELSELGWAFGFRLVCSMTPEEFDLVNLRSGECWIVVHDSSGQEYFVDGFDSWDGVSEVRLLTRTINEPLLGLAHLRYDPQVTVECDWCKSNVLVVELSNTSRTDELYETASQRSEANERLIERLRSITPAHVRIADFVIANLVEIDFGAIGVDVEVASESEVVVQAFAAFDVEPEGEPALDEDNGPQLEVEMEVL